MFTTANRRWWATNVKGVSGERDLLSVFAHYSSFERAKFLAWLDRSENSLDLPGDIEQDLFSRVAYRYHIRSIL